MKWGQTAVHERLLRVMTFGDVRSTARPTLARPTPAQATARIRPAQALTSVAQLLADPGQAVATSVSATPDAEAHQ